MIIADIRRRPVAALATVVLISIGLALGIWQLQRASYKEELGAKFEQAAKANPLLINDQLFKSEQAINHKVQAKGFYLKDKGIWLENRPHPLGRDPQTGITTGFYLLMPFQLSGDSKKIIWVNRGWAPRHFEKMNQVPEIMTPTGELVLTGIALEGASKTYALGKDGNLVASDGLPIQENLDLSKEQKNLGRNQYMFVLRQDDPEYKDGLQRQWPAPDSGVQKHLGYAFQWFALALMSLVFWLVTAYRAKSNSLR